MVDYTLAEAESSVKPESCVALGREICSLLGGLEHMLARSERKHPDSDKSVPIEARGSCSLRKKWRLIWKQACQEMTLQHPQHPHPYFWQ